MSATVAAVTVLMAFHAVIAIHELGHALAARATGLRIRRLVLGFGGIGRSRITLKTRIAGIPVEIGPVPLYGLIEVEPDELSAPWAAASVLVLVNGRAVSQTSCPRPGPPPPSPPSQAP